LFGAEPEYLGAGRTGKVDGGKAYCAVAGRGAAMASPARTTAARERMTRRVRGSLEFSFLDRYRLVLWFEWLTGGDAAIICL